MLLLSVSSLLLNRSLAQREPCAETTVVGVLPEALLASSVLCPPHRGVPDDSVREARTRGAHRKERTREGLGSTHGDLFPAVTHFFSPAKAGKELEISKRHGLRLVEQLAALQAENEWLTSERIQQMEHAMNSAMVGAEQEDQSDKEDMVVDSPRGAAGLECAGGQVQK